MMGTLFKICFFSLAGIVLAWGSALLKPVLAQTLDSELTGLTGPIQDPGLLEELMRRGLRGTALAEDTLTQLPSGSFRDRLLSASGVVAVRLALLVPHLPAFLLFLGAAAAAGLWARERIRHGETHASPSKGSPAKALAILSLVGLSLFALTPLALPLWTLWLFSFAFAGASGVWLANLPPKL